jgi:membrane associated rhomboid family serine protease
MTNPLRRPFRYRYDNVAYILIGINVAVYILEQLFRGIVPYLAMNPLLVLGRGWVWQFATYMFVHDPNSWSHLIFNMIALLVFGPPVERELGSKDFLLFYMLTGILAGVFSFLVYWALDYYTIFLMGASGALFALQLAYAVIFPNARLLLWGIIPMRAPVMVLGFTALELVLMFVGGGNVAHGTHLAGFVFGWLYFVARYGVNPWRRMLNR